MGGVCPTKEVRFINEKKKAQKHKKGGTRAGGQ